MHPMVDPRAPVTVIAKGLPASPGAAIGEAVFDADEAEALAKKGRSVILIRPETSPEDFHGMVAAKAILTARGGMTSHAAVVARGMGKTCVVGAQELDVDPRAGRFRANGRVVKRGQVITVDGTSGRVLLGEAKLTLPKVGTHYAKLMMWADGRRRLRVRANADTPEDAKRAREFGAEGIGLCRTEHMFFEGDRINAMRSPSCCRCSAPTSRGSSRRWPAIRSRFDCSIRRCTSSCRTARKSSPAWRAP
jgi:pyruvate,orthophosphate dikinase